ncbi:MAG: ABC transporter substrate-binding protein [Propionibacteriaceae bacterium]
MTHLPFEAPDAGHPGDEGSVRTPLVASRRRFLSIGGLALGGAILGVGAAGCGTAQTKQNTSTDGAPAGRAGASGDTLFVFVASGVPTNFNPLGATPAWPTASGQSQLIYETLLRFNLLDGSLQPGLAKELQEPDKSTLVLPLQEGTKWSDGSELTADDVVYTFEIAKKASLNYSNVWTYLDSITATDPRTVTFKIKADPFNPASVKDAIASVFIVPKAIWEPFGTDLAKQENLKPIGSGPFVLDKYDQTQINLTRFDGYWGTSVFGTPAMKTINHPIFKSNNDSDLKFEGGQLDAVQTFTTQIWKMWEDKKKPIGTWLKKAPYYLPGNLPLLEINGTVKGLDNPKVRLAIAHCIDYANIAKTAMSSYSDPANASLILPNGSEGKFYDKEGVASTGWTYDPQKAIDILENELNCKKGGDGIYSLPDGTRLGPWKAITPTGWTDWNTALEIVAKSCKAVGIDVKTEFPQSPQVTVMLQNGDFELACWNASGVSIASPWTRFRDVLDDRGIPPIGKTAFANFTRFKHPDVPALLDSIGNATSDEELKGIYSKLDAIYREGIPVVPLMYRPNEFYQYNESNWTNFPDENNPYAPPGWTGASIGWFFKIKKIGT